MTFSAEGAKFASWITRTHPRTVVDLSANSMLTSSGLHWRHSDLPGPRSSRWMQERRTIK